MLMQWRVTLPLYDFLNTETGEQFTKMLKLAERETFLAENPHIRTQILSAPGFARNSTGGIRNDAGWNENLQRIAEAHPKSALADKVKGRTSKEVLVDKAAKKAGYGKGGSYSMKEFSDS